MLDFLIPLTITFFIVLFMLSLIMLTGTMGFDDIRSDLEEFKKWLESIPIRFMEKWKQLVKESKGSVRHND